MATTNLYLDTRAIKDPDHQKAPVKVRVAFGNSTILLPTAITIRKDQWMEGIIINHPRAKLWNNFLKIRLLDVSSEVIRLESSGDLSGMTPAQLKKHLMSVIGNDEPAKSDEAKFWPILEEYISRCKTPGTANVYRQTASRLADFDRYIEERTFKDMTSTWLTKFDEFLSITAPKKNARNIHFRNIRAVFNYAINQKNLDIPYPFRTFKITAEPTESRALNIDQLRLLKDYQGLEPHLEKYRDIFMLMVYLMGINAADLFTAPKNAIIGGRLEYKRKKTGTLYSIKVEPEAQAIIDKYAGKGFLLDVCDTYSNPTDYLRRMDAGLKKIGPMERKGRGGKKVYRPILPMLSSYYSRHTWASLCAELSIPIEVTSEGLGHKIGSPVTAIYIHYQRKQVDDANRKVIDYITDKKGRC